MLRDLTRADWLRILELPTERVPRVAVLRGTRNLKNHYARYRDLFSDVIDLGSPNAVLEDVLVGRLNGIDIGFAAAYGAPMASEVTHLFGALGTRLIIQTGCCGALAPGMQAGDLVLPSVAFCGEGASQYYMPGSTWLEASAERLAQTHGLLQAMPLDDLAVHRVPIYTTSAMFAEGPDDLDRWHTLGCGAVDMETSATYAVAQHFGMQRVALLFVFDNPREGSHVLLQEDDKEARRRLGEAAMIKAALALAMCATDQDEG